MPALTSIAISDAARLAGNSEHSMRECVRAGIVRFVRDGYIHIGADEVERLTGEPITMERLLEPVTAAEPKPRYNREQNRVSDRRE
jgi:hypothetical protein